MFKLLKYLPLVASGRNIAKQYREENDAKRPVYLSRRFIGAVIATVGLFLALHYDVKLDDKVLAELADNIHQIITAGVALYGAILTIIGFFGREKKGE